MKYQLIIKVPFEAMDDLAARQKAAGLMSDYITDIDKTMPGNEAKLQEVYPDKPPRGVQLFIE